MASRAHRWNGTTPLSAFHGGTAKSALRAINEAKQKARDAARYADWVSRGKPAAPSAPPRKDRLRPGARANKRQRLFVAQDGRCGICDYPLASPEAATIDHVVPRARGGSTSGNVLLAHSHCNNWKADREPTRIELQRLAAINALIAQ